MGNELNRIFDCDNVVVQKQIALEEAKGKVKIAREELDQAVMKLHEAIQEAKNPSLAFKDESEKVSKKAASKGKEK